jgi:FKBP-type peptidyl-prolyl cis-trans isomerase 2
LKWCIERAENVVKHKEKDMRICRVLCALLLAGFVATGCSGSAKKTGNIIEAGKQVSLDYTLTVDDKVVDSSEVKGPLKYTHGTGQINVEFSRQLEGLSVGEERMIVLPPEKAYGPIKNEMMQELPKSKLPPDVAPAVGMQVQGKSPDGKTVMARVADVKADSVLLDFNHPLAGKTLVFKIKVLTIQ